MRRALALTLLVACGSPPPPPSEPAATTALRAVRASAPHIDGELDDAGWAAAPVSSRFVDASSGEAITPYTEARAVFDDDALTLALYGADEDVRSTDRMGVILHVAGGRTFVVEVSPDATVRWHAPASAPEDPPDGVVAAVDADATLDLDDLEDEEWIVELRVPWRALGMDGPADVRANFFRRDQPRGSLVRSLAWSPWRGEPTSAVATLGAIRVSD